MFEFELTELRVSCDGMFFTGVSSLCSLVNLFREAGLSSNYCRFRCFIGKIIMFL